MKSILVSIVAAVFLVGCGQSDHQHSHDDDHSHAEGDHHHAEGDIDDHDKELKAAEPVVEASQPESPTAKAPDISIHEAIEKGNIEAVKQHLAAGTDVNSKDEDVELTPLQMAAGEGQKEIAELLIAKGADVNAMTADGLTALFAAILGPNKEIVELLIAKGADVNARGFLGMTPLNMAADEGQKETADLLRKHGGKTGEELKAEGK
jgi:cytohesin